LRRQEAGEGVEEQPQIRIPRTQPAMPSTALSGQELAEELPLRGAERGSHGQIVPARHGPGKKQASDVRARDQEQESDGSQKQQQRAAIAADELLVQRDHQDAALRVRVGVGCGDGGDDGGELGAGLLEGRVRPKPAGELVEEERADVEQVSPAPPGPYPDAAAGPRVESSRRHDVPPR
jgi:hypothetical protein